MQTSYYHAGCRILRRTAALSSSCSSRPISSSSSSTSPYVLVCEHCDLYKFGDPTFEPARALFRNVNWRIRNSCSRYSAAPVDACASTSAASDGPLPDEAHPTAWAIVGPQAGLLVDAALLGRARAEPPLSRQWPFLGKTRLVEDAIKKVAFSTRLESKLPGSIAGEFTDYTARYYSIRPDEAESLTLRDHLVKYLPLEEDSTGHPVQPSEEDEAFLLTTAQALKIDHLLQIPLVALSNGQTRRARIARALLTKPELLVLEEPFTGLDAPSRALVSRLLCDMHMQANPRILLTLRPQDAIPEWIDGIVETERRPRQELKYVGARSAWQRPSAVAPESSSTRSTKPRRKRPLQEAPKIIQLDGANVSYGERRVLRDVTWHIQAGERIVLSGANGSGKSTLLSLILGDHPASFSQSLSILGRPRTQHSVYTLSNSIGQFSPELYASFPRRYGDAGLSLFEVIGTGFDNIFSYRKLTTEQKDAVSVLVSEFDPGRAVFTDQLLQQTLFAEAAPPIQALSLILRALVKRPPLVVLDEPFAGMDDHLVQMCRRYLDTKLAADQTLLFISHYEEEWPATVGRRFHLEDGVGIDVRLV